MKKGILYTLILCSSVLLIGCGQKKRAQVTYESVDAITAEADQAYESGNYTDALTSYADAIRTNPLSIDAQIGAAKCQMALEDYAMASENLSAAARIDPQAPEIYDMYLELADASKNSSYARAAVNLAKTNHMESFLVRMPKEPVLSLEEGKYDSRQELTITAEEGAEIMVTERNGNTWFSYTYDGKPIRLLSGETTITAYCVKDRVPGDEVSATYQCTYQPTEIRFSDPAIEAGIRDALDRESGPITDLDCEGLSSLYCNPDQIKSEDREERRTIETLEDLKYLPKLQSISIYNYGITADLNELGTCRLLYSVYIQRCGVSDISFVKDLTQLRNLDVSGNEELTDISPAADCEGLKSLRIDGTGVTDLSSLYEKELDDIQLELTDELNGAVLSNWKDSLVQLQLYDCGGRDLSWLKDFTSLRYLDLYAASYNASYDEETDPLTGLEFLSSLTNLTSLELRGLGDVSSLEYIKKLKNLTYLYFSMNDRDTEVPEDLLVDLQKSLPNCSISHY